MFQLTRFSHNTVFFRNQNARYAGTRCTFSWHPNLKLDGASHLILFSVKDEKQEFMIILTHFFYFNFLKLLTRWAHDIPWTMRVFLWSTIQEIMVKTYLNPRNSLLSLHHSRCFGWLTITDLKEKKEHSLLRIR